MKLPVMFADESFFREDKSAGMRIRFEHAREFGSERRDRTGSRGPARGDYRHGANSGDRRGGTRTPERGRPIERIEGPSSAAVRAATGFQPKPPPHGTGNAERSGGKRRKGEKARNEPPVTGAGSRQARFAQATGATAPSKTPSDKGPRRDDRGGQNSLYQLPIEERIAYYRKKYGKENERRNDRGNEGDRPVSTQQNRAGKEAPIAARETAGRQSKGTEPPSPPPKPMEKSAPLPAAGSAEKKSLLRKLADLFKNDRKEGK
jgi:hypothetical protein